MNAREEYDRLQSFIARSEFTVTAEDIARRDELQAKLLRRGKPLLDWFIRSEHFEHWDAENRSTGSCGIILQDPDRFDRMWDAAEDGAEGSTHGEVISDWRDAWESFTWGRDLERVDAAITAAIDAVENWHFENGSLDQQVG
jgi:hypothetical protein